MNVVTSTVHRAKQRFTSAIKDTTPDTVTSYPSLSAPLVTLYVTPRLRNESLAAFEVLAESRTGFRVERAADDQVSAEFGGQLQVGIAEIRRLKDALLHFERDFLYSNPDLTTMIEPLRDPSVQLRSEQELAEQIEQARTQLEYSLR